MAGLPSNALIGLEVKTRMYPMQDIETLIADYHKDTHAGKLVMRVSEDLN